MATNERGHQKVGFFDWLVKEINSGNYEGLHWLDENRTTFRITWKHNSRKDLVAMDYKIFQAWAMFSKKYNKDMPDLAKWKINFRCAMMSTKRFEEVKLNNPDYHVYRIIRANTTPAANYPATTNNGSDHEDDQLHISPYSERAPTLFRSKPPQQQEINVAFKTLSLENPVPGPDGTTAENLNEHGGDLLQCIMQQTKLNLPFSWSPVPVGHCLGEAPYDQSSVHAIQNSCLLLENGVVTEPVVNNGYEEPSSWLAENTPNAGSRMAVPLAPQQAQQNSPDTNQINHVAEALYSNDCFIENMFMNEEPQGDEVMNNATRNDCQPTDQQVMMQQNIFAHPVVAPVQHPPVSTAPLHNNTAGTIPLNLDISIYYRGKLLYESGVDVSSCMFTYNNYHHYNVLDSLQIIEFPSPENLPDRKQIKHTSTLLQNAGLLLYQKSNKICAKRLGKCKVFWAFSKQLYNMAEHPQPRLLPREEDTEIFNYEKFWQELKDFCERRSCSPDYTIYLCFGQCFTAAKPKESKLILVKLVPKLCKHWHEKAQEEGASSLNSESSLLLSHSLPDLMEYLNNILMPTEEAP